MAARQKLWIRLSLTTEIAIRKRSVVLVLIEDKNVSFLKPQTRRIAETHTYTVECEATCDRCKALHVSDMNVYSMRLTYYAQELQNYRVPDTSREHM